MARLPAGWARKPGGTTIATTVAIRTRSGSTNAWLEVDYQGLEAPTALFADLAQIGWKPPTIAPPPHHAIDWTQPNEATGERFTLRAYAVEGAIVASPGGTGARGTWTDAERVTHLGALGRVLGRHPAVALDDPRGLLAASAGPTPDPPRRSPARPAGRRRRVLP